MDYWERSTVAWHHDEICTIPVKHEDLMLLVGRKVRWYYECSETVCERKVLTLEKTGTILCFLGVTPFRVLQPLL